MLTVQDLLAHKGKQVYTIDHTSSVFDAIASMNEKNVGALIVTHRKDEREDVCGIVSERDYLRHVILKGRSSRQTPVREIMTRQVVYADPSTPIEEVLGIMSERRFRHMPIMANDKLAGIVSIGDCVKSIIKDQEYQIRTLTDYISDTYPGPKPEV